GADADRDLVVVLHGGDGLGLEFRFAGGDAVPVRRGRGWLLSECDQGVHHLAAVERARAGARDHVDERTLGRRLHATAGGESAEADVVAALVRVVRWYRGRMGGAVLLLVPGQ